MDQPEEIIEKLDQEITLQLQQIDSNLSYCFNTITKNIIPKVTRYGAICDDIMDSGNWLGTMFQQTAAVDLKLNNPLVVEEQLDASGTGASKGAQPESLFPTAGGRKLVDSSGELAIPPSNASMSEDDFHTANVTTTTTGRILRLPSDSSEEENDDDSKRVAREADGSTLQRQRRKRKVSLLLQREYGSSSSMGLSPVHVNSNKLRNPDEEDDSLGSSPMKVHQDTQDESTKEVPVPGTVIHFATASGSGAGAASNL